MYREGNYQTNIESLYYSSLYNNRLLTLYKDKQLIVHSFHINHDDLGKEYAEFNRY
jgi:hypothetical protein